MSELSHAMGVLEVMNGPNWDGQYEVYLAALERVPEELLRPAVSALAGEKWRPSPAEIVQQAARCEMCRRAGTTHPFPSADEAYAEIMQLAKRIGRNGQQLPGHPCITLPGAPPFSHPLVAKTVALVGGWERICSGEAGYDEGLGKQIKAAYARQAEAWVDLAARSLAQPEELRGAYFPRWRPFEIEYEWAEPSERLIEAAESPELVPMPEEIRAKLSALMGRLSSE